ncbi:MAG: hypothetical protein QOI73_2716 [Solirubrobacteraceae bacterium]|nr:hypothetical protein [Solirubrobacteraceae bacterium]
MAIGNLYRPAARLWAKATPQSNLRAVRAMFTDAIDRGLHPGPNPFANMRLDHSRGHKDLMALTEAEPHAFADCALDVHDGYGPALRAMILFAGYVGLRPGELCHSNVAMWPATRSRSVGPSAQGVEVRLGAGRDAASAGA